MTWAERFAWTKRRSQSRSQPRQTESRPKPRVVTDPYTIQDIPAQYLEANERFLRQLHEGSYDFIDLGTCDGGGFDIAYRQNGRRGLGFDLDPLYVQRGFDRGLDVACMDVRALRTHSSYVDFAVCSHVLEHLPSIYDVGSILNSLRSLCRDYLLISGPCFEEEDYVYGHNLKILHSAMLDHSCKLRVVDLVDILHELRLRDYTIALSEPLPTSDSPWIYRADEPGDGLWMYDPAKNLPKPHIEFDRRLYRDFVCVVQLRPDIETDRILQNFLWGYDKVVFRSTWDF